MNFATAYNKPESNNVGGRRTLQLRPRIVEFLDRLKPKRRIAAPAAYGLSSLLDLNGNPTTIGDHVGKGMWSVAIVWSSGCPICASEIPRYGAYFASEPEPKFSVLGVAIDGFAQKERVIETMERWNLGFPTLVAAFPEPNWTLCELPKASTFGTPTFMLFTPSGRLAMLQVGPVWISELEKFIRDYSLR